LFNGGTLKSAVFDIETSALEAVGSGVCLCACIRPLSTNRTRTFRVDNYKHKPDPKFGFLERQEREMMTELLDELRKYDLLIGQNIINFDLGYLRSRAYRLGIPFFLSPFVYDTKNAFQRVKMRTVMNAIGKPSASLDMIADFFGVAQLKTKIYPVEHWKNVWGNEQERMEAMNNLVDHCQRDVIMNARIYDVMLPFDTRATLKRWL
jgi:DNA polymerase elongation subunit (family B)